MQPGTYNIVAPANAMWTEAWTIDSITTTTGYTARIDFRAGPTDADTLLLSLTSPSSGITLTAPSSALVVTPKITASQMDTLRAAMVTANVTEAHYALKITPPTGADDALIYLTGVLTTTNTTVP